MKLRVGEGTSRFTPDLDAALDVGLGLDDYFDQKLHACTSVNPRTGGNERAIAR